MKLLGPYALHNLKCQQEFQQLHWPCSLNYGLGVSVQGTINSTGAGDVFIAGRMEGLKP